MFILLAFVLFHQPVYELNFW